MKKLSKTAIIGVISLASVVATVGFAGAATFSKSGHFPMTLGIFANKGGNKIGQRGLIDINIVSKDLGISLPDLKTGFKAGKSINEIATDKGVSDKLATLTSDLEKSASAKIDQAGAAGKLTADQVTAMKAKIPQQVQDFLSNKRLNMDNKKGMVVRKPMGFLDMSIITKDLNMTLADLTTELKSGKSISDVATAKNIDITKLTQDLADAASTKIDQAVQAGKLSADKAKTIKDNLPKQIGAFLNNKGHKPMNKMGYKGSSSTPANLQL